MLRLKTLALIGLFVTGLLSACGGPTPTADTPQPTSPPDSGYPALPPTITPGGAYPPPPRPTVTVVYNYPAGQATQSVANQAPPVAAATSTALPTDLPVASPTPGLVIIVYKDIEIQPAQTTVKAGTQVNFFIQDSVHQPYAGTTQPFIFEAPNNLQPGTNWPYTFNTPGTFTILCGYHPTMSATLVVEP